MIILAIKINIYIPFSKSIKDKRNITRKFKDKIKFKFNVNAAELPLHSNKRSCIGIVLCNKDKTILEKVLTKIIEYANFNFLDVIDKIEYNYFYF